LALLLRRAIASMREPREPGAYRGRDGAAAQAARSRQNSARVEDLIAVDLIAVNLIAVNLIAFRISQKRELP
jgi:hypothetical protein